jgi:hypothetical protein
MGAVFRNAGVDTGGIQNRLGALFFMLLYLSFMSLGSLPVWHEERLLFARERAAGAYGTNAYVAAVLLFDLLPLRVLPPFFFGFITYDLIGLHAHCKLCLAWFVLVLVLTNVTATMFSMAVGAAASCVAVANVVGSLCFMTFALFGGFLLSKTDMPSYVRWLAGVSFLNNGFEALVVNEFHDNNVNFYFTSAVNSSVFPAPIPVTGDQVCSPLFCFCARVVCLVLASLSYFTAPPDAFADFDHVWLPRRGLHSRRLRVVRDGCHLRTPDVCAAEVLRGWSMGDSVRKAALTRRTDCWRRAAARAHAGRQ